MTTLTREQAERWLNQMTKPWEITYYDTRRDDTVKVTNAPTRETIEVWINGLPDDWQVLLREMAERRQRNLDGAGEM